MHQGFKQAISMEIDAISMEINARMPQREDSPPDSDPAVAAEEEKAKAENKAAFAHLANCLTASRDLGYVRRGKTDAWPNGLAVVVLKCMFGRYKPDEATAMVD
jgi:hypothetical protein